MSDGFVNAIGSASGDADSVRVVYQVPAGLLINQRAGIDCTGYESVIILARADDDVSDYFVETWFYDDDRISAACRGASMTVQGRGNLMPPFAFGEQENHWIQVPVTGKYMIISVDPGRVSGIATTTPLTVTYILSHRITNRVQGFMAGRTLDLFDGLANSRQYEPGMKRYTSQWLLAVAGAADDRVICYPPCGIGLVQLTLRINHVASRLVTCYAQSALLDPGNLNIYNGQYSKATLNVESWTFINPASPLRIYLRNHDASQLEASITHVWDDTV